MFLLFLTTFNSSKVFCFNINLVYLIFMFCDRQTSLIVVFKIIVFVNVHGVGGNKVMGDCHGRCGDAVQVQMFQIIGDRCGSVRLLQEQVYSYDPNDNEQPMQYLCIYQNFLNISLHSSLIWFFFCWSKRSMKPYLYWWMNQLHWFPQMAYDIYKGYDVNIFRYFTWVIFTCGWVYPISSSSSFFL